MKKGLTTIKFHGKFGKFMGREFKVKISSVKEAFRAVDSLSGRKFTKFFLEDKENLNADYRVLVNGKEMASSHSKIDTLEKATESELFMQNENLETIDIIPMVKGSDDFMSIFIIIVGVILIATGVGSPEGFALLGMSSAMTTTVLVVAGIGLIAAGISNLLTEMRVRNIEKND
jgi:predicted phage tail protein